MPETSEKPPAELRLTGRSVAVERPAPPTAAQCLELMKLIRSATRAVATSLDQHEQIQTAVAGVEAYLQSQSAVGIQSNG